MNARAKKVIAKALALPEEDRAALASLLLDSLHDGEDLDGQLLHEVARRLKEIDDGTAKLIPGDEVLTELRASLK